MAVLGREELRNQLKKREFAPVYLLFGAETFLRDLAAKTIADLVLADSSLREFNEIEYSLNDSPISHALSDAEQLPMIASRRIVRVSDIIISAPGKRENLKEEDEPLLNRYLERPSETSIVIFVAEELDKRRKVARLLLEKCVAVEFAQLSDNELIKWANDKIRELGARAEDKAVRQLVALVGNNVRRLTNEIEKVAAAALPDDLITFELVESLVANSRVIDNFGLTDNLMVKNKGKTIHILKKLLDDGAEPLMLLGLIASNFRKLALAKELMGQGVERREILRVIKMPPFKHEEFIASARRADREELSRVLNKIAETDLAIKTSRGGGGKTGSRLQIEMLVYELLSF
ncbi:MAG: DNA polymerase III subunit delta [Pyrinomonadaceae bacterium]